MNKHSAFLIYLNLLTKPERTALCGLGLMLALFVLGTYLSWTNPIGRSAGGIASGVLIVALLCICVLSVAVVNLLVRNRQLRNSSSKESYAALHDPLTGTANRRKFEQQLDQMVGEAAPRHVLLVLDLDRFKPVNDLYGHAAGDALLKEISAGLQRLVKPDDLVARLGGDEFAILLCNADEKMAKTVALRALNFVMKFRLDWQGSRISVGTSIGLVSINQPGMQGSVLMAIADEALYTAKEAGRGAAFLAIANSGSQGKNALKRLDAGTPPPQKSARSHKPEDGRAQELLATVAACRMDGEKDDPEHRRGSRRRHSIRNWVFVEPRTKNDGLSSGMQVRELMDDASARSDGGADLARWMLVKALDAAAYLSPSEIDHIGFVLPIPSRCIDIVPDMAEELMRINALAHLPLRHITLLLYNINSVYKSAEIEKFQQRLAMSKVGLAMEIRGSTLDLLAPLQKVKYEEIHLGRELIKNLRPGTNAYAAIESLITVAEQNDTSVVASDVRTAEELRSLATLGIQKFSGSLVKEPAPLHDVLAGITNS